MNEQVELGLIETGPIEIDGEIYFMLSLHGVYDNPIIILLNYEQAKALFLAFDDYLSEVEYEDKVI